LFLYVVEHDVTVIKLKFDVKYKGIFLKSQGEKNALKTEIKGRLVVIFKNLISKTVIPEIF